MQFVQPFDARQFDPSSFPPPPVLADYHVQIVESEAKENNAKDGGYLQLDLEILDPGPYKGTKVPYRLNLYHTNAQTVQIAYRQLSAICHVTGQFNVQDSRQLHNIPFIATIGPQVGNPQYSNVFFVKDLNGVIPGAKTAQPVAAGFPAAAPPVAAPAWAPAGTAPVATPGWQPGPPAAPPVVTPPTWAPPGASAPASAPASAAPPAWAPPVATAPPAPAAWTPGAPASATPPWGPPR